MTLLTPSPHFHTKELTSSLFRHHWAAAVAPNAPWPNNAVQNADSAH